MPMNTDRGLRSYVKPIWQLLQATQTEDRKGELSKGSTRESFHIWAKSLFFQAAPYFMLSPHGPDMEISPNEFDQLRDPFSSSPPLLSSLGPLILVVDLWSGDRIWKRRDKSSPDFELKVTFSEPRRCADTDKQETEQDQKLRYHDPRHVTLSETVVDSDDNVQCHVYGVRDCSDRRSFSFFVPSFRNHLVFPSYSNFQIVFYATTCENKDNGSVSNEKLELFSAIKALAFFSLWQELRRKRPKWLHATTWNAKSKTKSRLGFGIPKRCWCGVTGWRWNAEWTLAWTWRTWMARLTRMERGTGNRKNRVVAALY